MKLTWSDRLRRSWRCIELSRQSESYLRQLDDIIRVSHPCENNYITSYWFHWTEEASIEYQLWIIDQPVLVEWNNLDVFGLSQCVHQKIYVMQLGISFQFKVFALIDHASVAFAGVLI